jgi:ABC transport system ATP-binding/permease protein
VSHDRWFLDRVATGILAFEGDGNVTFYEGSYSFYAERRPKSSTPMAAKLDKAEPKPDSRGERTKPVAPRKLTFKEKAELAAMETTIVAAEAAVSTLEHTLQDPAVFKDRAAEVPALIAQLEVARAEVTRLYARWEELAAIPAG